MLKYEEEAQQKARSLSNRELFDEVIERANPDDYDACWTTQGWNEFLIYKKVLEDRLNSWLKE